MIDTWFRSCIYSLIYFLLCIHPLFVYFSSTTLWSFPAPLSGVTPTTPQLHSCVNPKSSTDAWPWPHSSGTSSNQTESTSHGQSISMATLSPSRPARRQNNGMRSLPLPSGKSSYSLDSSNGTRRPLVRTTCVAVCRERTPNSVNSV